MALSSSTSGTIAVGSFGAVSFNGVEALRQTGTAADLSLTPPSAAANTMTLDDDGALGNGLLRLSAPSMLPIVFANPTGALSILRGHMSDVLNVGTTSATSLADFAAGLTLGAAATPISTINVPAGATLPVDRSWTAFATFAINFTNANSDWTASGTGAISLTAGSKIGLVSGSSLSVVNGNLTLSANQLAVASTGNFHGIDINGATVSSSGAGNVTVLGRGGDNSAGVQYGVYVYGGGLIRGGTSGLAHVAGTGGTSFGPDTSGVKLGGVAPGGVITSLGAIVEVVGQAGGGMFGGGANRGVYLDARSGSMATISAAGLGTVTVRGTGSTVGGESTGVRLLSQPAMITSAGGRVEVVGTGGSSGLFNQVGLLIQGGTISAGPGADLLVRGTGGANSSSNSTGIVLQNGSTETGGIGLGSITVDGGHGQIIGEAGSANSSSNGISTSGGLVSAGSTGSLTITGTAASSGFNGGEWGLAFQSVLQSAGANVTLIGRGGFLHGMYFGPLSTSQLQGSSVLRLEGIHGTAPFGSGITMAGLTAPFNHTGTGGMQIITDRLTTASGAPYTFATGSISIDTYTPGVPITVGSVAPEGMRVDPFFLTVLSPATLNIGSPASGKVTISSTVVRSGPEQLNLTSGGAIEFAMGGAIHTPLGGLKLLPGPAGFTPAATMPDAVVGNQVTFAPGSKLNIIPAGAGATQALEVTGGVDVTGVTLVVSGFEALPPTQPLIIVDNDGTDPVVGTFTGLPEGAIVNVNGLTRKLTYIGGSGNDVELIYNRPPTLTTIPPQTVNEDSGPTTINLTGITSGTETQALQVTATTNLPLVMADPVVSYTSPNATGTLTFAPLPDQFGSVVVTVTVRDAGFDGVLNTADDGLFAPTFVVDIAPINDAPSFVKGANLTVPYNAPAQTVAAWATAISAGPNESSQTVSFSVTNNTHPDLFMVPPAVAADGTLTFTPATGAFGVATITLRIEDSGGTANGGVDTSASQTFTITINPPPTFQVTTFVPTSTGGIMNLSRDVDLSQLNLYDISGNVFGAADIAFRGSAGNVIKGSAIVDPSLRRITFVATSGRLPADDYTLTLRSAANGFRDSNGELLDGDADGTAGGDFVRTFTVAPDAAGTVVLQLPNFARGPLQPVNIPALATSGLPISFSDGGGITSASFELRYNPSILTIGGATVAPGLPVGAAVTIDTTTAGVAVIQFNSPTPLAAGTTRFIDLQATVPNGPNYRAKQVLDLRNIVLNGGAIPAADDDAVHVNVYFGDTTGNGTYSGQDGSNVARLATGAGNGLQEFKLVDALIIADITGNGGFAASDTSRIQQASVALAVEEIPRLPVPAASIVVGGPDPKLSIPQDLHATAGGQLTIPVHIDSIVDHTGGGLESGELVIYYDATVFDLQRVSLGSLLTAIPGWTFAARIDALAGRVFISFSGLTPLEGYFQGELVRLHAQVKPGATPGPTAINLAATARDVAVTTQLNEGWLTLIPAPTDAANDPGVDGIVTIVTASNPQPAAPTAQIVGDNELQVTGTDGDDHLVVAPLGADLIRVRAGARILGMFPSPQSIVIVSQTGSDQVIAAPTSIPTLIAMHDDDDSHDEIFAGDNSTVLTTNPWTPGTGETLGSAASDQSEHNLALLHLLANWPDDQANDSNGSEPVRRTGMRRR